MSEMVLVLDFGGQYKELIGAMARGLSVYSEIKPGNIKIDEIKKLKPIGIILTGGSESVYSNGGCDKKIFSLGIPILGISYGMHLMCYTLGGKVEPGGEFGPVTVKPSGKSKLYNDKKEPFTALMSHKDHVTRLPEGFHITAKTKNSIAACENNAKKLYATQFHPEAKHTEGGRKIIRRFLYDICGASGDYKLDDYIAYQINQIQEKARDNKVLLALSGGVDSSVCASLLSKAIPGQLSCIFVDHGCMRLNEGDEIERVFSAQELRFIRVNAQERFLAKLEGVIDPEKKRKIIGEEFIRVFEEEAAKLGNIPLLAQGTIYPDIIESGGKHSALIKSHHNVGGLPENLKFTGIIEPLSGLFKDEVRVLGKKLKLPSSIVNRQPFPGPGLAVRIMGGITREKLDVLRKADAVLREELDKMKHRPNQYFCVLTDTRSVGVKGDERTYDYVIAVRAVITDDFMTCEYAPLPHKLLNRIASRITGEIPSANRVVYDITSKPPATVEWE
jgi:GMP synthase (glutamine-hydrolysing)